MKKKLERLILNFDDPTAEETEAHQRMAEEIELEEFYKDYSDEQLTKRYAEFLRAVETSGINVEKPFANTLKKIKHLREIMGYGVLYGKGGEPVKLKDATASRIGKAYLNIYNQARKHCNKQA